ncbi:MAG: FAD:protein FMN transferase [Verrucomicrobia bacterium]|nr:FAD:protein FMN transferase [Verrucomicrobiota bacterium]
MSRVLKLHLFLRFYRAGSLLVLIVLVHQQTRWFEAQRGSTVSLRQARRIFPTANRVQLRDAERGLHYVTDARGGIIGCLFTTAPHTDNIIGYAGPNDLLIALDRTGAVVGVELLRSGDTEEHVRQVKRDPGFWRGFVGWKPGEAPPPKIAGVSGATLTSFAIAESIQQRLAGAAPSLRFPEPVTFDEVRALFPNATRLVPDQSRLRALDAAGHLLGFAVRTSPQADNVAGYRGPTECLVALAPDGRTVLDVRVRKSYDTDSYVDQLRRAESFLKSFIGRSVNELAVLEAPTKEKTEAISGATMTARAIAEGIKRRSMSEVAAQTPAPQWRPKPRDCALAGVIAGALVMSFTSLRGQRWARLAWQLLLVGYVGLVNHDLLSLALLGGWAANGLALKAAPGLVLLAAAALLVPWTTRRQLYCHQICPHGAAQQLLGGLSRLVRSWSSRRKKSSKSKFEISNLKSQIEAGLAPSAAESTKPSAPSPTFVCHRRTLPAKLTHSLELLPGSLLGLALLTLLLGWPVNLVNLEPFDAWAWRTAGLVTLIIAVLGLAASLFVPQAYCRFGCPTGALLNFVRSSGSADHWGRRDWAALGFVAAGLVAVFAVRAWPRTELAPEPLTFTGRAMGTTWSVKIHDEVAEPSVIDKAIADEFEWAESLTSHWRTNTDLSIFNRTATTDPLPVPWPVLTLARWSAEISRATEGAFDITVGPLVRLWGFGPGPRRTGPPSDSEISAALPAAGWQKLEVLDGLLRKQHPALEVDLSSIAKGWSIDQVAQLLERRGFTDFFVEAGGELRARGRWTIAIEHPPRACTLTNEAIATSGTYRQNREAAGRVYSHLIDPRTGRPITHRTVSVSVRHADCAHADAWATALNVLGVEAGLPLADRLKLAAQFVVERSDAKLEVQQSAAWEEREVLANSPAAAKRKPKE